jgi:hypothetical protein
MSTHSKQFAVGAVMLVLLLLGVFAVAQFRKARMTTDSSAHAALAVEIEHQLRTIPHGQHYPDSLLQLRLTYPDGGGTSLLSRFTYRSTGTGCSVGTVLRGEEFVHSFP